MQLSDLQEKLEATITEVKQLIDLSVEYRKESPTAKKEVTQLWQQFLGELFAYLRLKSKESGENLLAGIGFPRFK